MLRAINDARVVTPGGVLEGHSVVIEDGLIAGFSRRPEGGERVLNAAGRYVLPGLVDLHSDAIEGQLMPRPEAEFPPPVAFLATDRLLASSGITTGFHALSFMDGFGRSPERGRRLYEMVVRYRSEGTVRHELHLRCELPDERSVDAVEALLSERKARIISVMDHTPGQGQFRDLEWYQRYRAQHVGADEREIARAVARVTHAHDGTPSERIDRIARAAGGAVFASHDDDTAERVELLAGKGVRISEFPVSEAAARRARELGTLVCVGAPNVVRGRSLSGNLSATEAVRLGLADALCSDYHPPSMLLAAFKLAGDGVLPLHQAVGLVSSGPARAAGLSDRGEVREGALADLLVVGERLGLPAVARTVVAGDVVLATGPGAPRYGSGRALVADAP